MTAMTRRGLIRVTALALLLLVLGGPVVGHPGGPGREPDLGDGDSLQVDAGHKVASWAYAEGVQIYKWNGTAWAFQRPEAVLYSGDGEDDEVVGLHYAGPTWESTSGSKVAARRIRDPYTPDATAIPWLLLEATASAGPGRYHRVTFIQRLYTTGGIAPADAGEFVGEEVGVPYTAWYVFYREHK
jgi:hypothetical protein